MTKAVLGFLIGLIVARTLGPYEFGLFSLFLVVMIFSQNLIGEGLDSGVVRFYALYHHDSPKKACAVLGSALRLRVAGGGTLLLCAMIGANAIAGLVSDDPKIPEIILYGVFCAFSGVFFTFCLAVFQAREDFFHYALLSPLVNLLRIAAVPLLLFFGLFTLQAVMLLHIIFFILGAVVGFWLLRREFVSARFDWKIFYKIFRFSRWTALANLCFLLQSHLAIPILTHSFDASSAGIYAAGASLLLFIDQITVAVITVLLPTVSRFSEVAQLRAFVRRIFPVLLIASLLLCTLVFFSRPLVLMIYGDQYESSILILKILLMGFLATLITHPLYLVLYALNKPNVYANTAFISLGIWLIAAYIFIPELGPQGAAWATLISRVAQGILIFTLVLTALSKLTGKVFSVDNQESKES